MRFIAKKLDMSVELVTLNEENVVLKAKTFVDSKKAIEILKEWIALESNQDGSAPQEVYAKELSIVYPKDQSWFIDNLDPATLREVAVHVASLLKGIRKN